MNTMEMQIETLLDCSLQAALELMAEERNGRRDLAFSKLRKPKVRDVPVVKSVEFGGYLIRELESGTIEVQQNGQSILPAKPVLRTLASALNLQY